MPSPPASVPRGLRPACRLIVYAALCMCALTSMACGRFSEANYRQAVQSGRTKIGTVAEMERVFADFDIQHFIGHNGGATRAMTWNTEVLLYDRYILTMQVPVVVNGEVSRVEKVAGEPRFWIHEVVEVRPLPRGRWGKTIGQNWEFDSEAWARMVEHDGDLEAIGIHLIKDRAVDDFRTVQDEVRRQREPR